MVDKMKKAMSGISDRYLANHWYDNMKLKASFAKKGKNKDYEMLMNVLRLA